MEEEKKPKRKPAAPKKAAEPKIGANDKAPATPKQPRKKAAAAKPVAKAEKASAPAKPLRSKTTTAKSRGTASKAPVKKKAEPKTPFWAPFAKSDVSKPEQREERSFRKQNEREERPERPSRNSSPQRDSMSERPVRKSPPRREDGSERPSRTSPPRREEHSDRPSRPFAERQDRPTERPARGEGRFSNRDNQQERPDSGKRFSKPRPSDNPRAAERPAKAGKLNEPMRLNKFLAHCGIAARRQSADFVKKGLVSVNGEVEPNPSYPVQPGDEVRFKGQVVRLEGRKVYILMNKPKDIITSASDEKGRRTVLDLIGNKVEERIFPVGRLDRNTSGLLLLTNDGDLAEKLAHPSHNVQKVYHVTLDKPFHKQDFEKVQKGLKLEDGLAEVDSLHYVAGTKDELEISLHIGRNRIVRRIFEHLGYEVIKLDRTYYAGLTKKDIGRGHFRHLTDQEVIMLKHFK